MKQVSIFNNVLGPVMRGPSSSHTAGSYHIGRAARDILGETPVAASIEFDERGSYAKVYAEQGSDRAFLCGLMDWDLLGEAFYDAADRATRESRRIRFGTGRFEEASHPNWVRLTMSGQRNDTQARVTAASTGGGSIRIFDVDGFPVDLKGDRWTTLVRLDAERLDSAVRFLERHGEATVSEKIVSERALIALNRSSQLPAEVMEALKRTFEAHCATIRPISFPLAGKALFENAREMESYARERKLSLGQAALAYECALLGMTQDDAIQEMGRRYAIMKDACERSLSGKFAFSMQLLRPFAHRIFESGQSGKLPFFGPHGRAAARAMALMHANNAMDVVCAAPTGGAAGALPGAVITLEEEFGLSPDKVCLALFAAGAVGMVLDTRATFAAEVAGCQVEIGAGGAMAAAATVEAAGGTPAQAFDAAAISFQNTMGSVCDLVQGMVEIPCHTRNAVAAASAFVCADLVMGGYENPIPLDETVDAVYQVGRMLPVELRCTALAGLATCPSALAMKRLR